MGRVVNIRRSRTEIFWRSGLRGMQETDLAWVAQMVERVLGKDEVTGSIPVPGSRVFGLRE